MKFLKLQNLTASYDQEVILHKMNLEVRQGELLSLLGSSGCGKTTTCAKLASFLKKKGKAPYLIAADLQRPAAIKQLETLAKNINVDIFKVMLFSTYNFYEVLLIFFAK